MTEYSIADRGEPLADQIYRQLAVGFHSGWYSPGQRFNIRSLAKAMGVSQTPIREALSRFISEGVLRLENRVIEVPLLCRDSVDELFDLRFMLEKKLAATAVKMMSDETVVDIEKIQKEFEGWMDKKDYKQVLKKNMEFHFHIYNAASLPLTVKLVEHLWLRIGPTMNLAYPVLDTALTGVRRHHTIIKSLRSRDVEAVCEAIEVDIRAAKDVLVKML